MIDCTWKRDGEKLRCIACNRVYPPDNPRRKHEVEVPGDESRWPKWTCKHQPDLEPAAARLGLTLDETPGFHQELARWQAAGYPERTEAERAAIAATNCESRREDGVCIARGCTNGVKTVKCEWMARMATENCLGNPCLFGDPKAAFKAELARAMETTP